MVRKLTLFLFLFISISSISRAVVRDSVAISLPPYTDTSCVGTQLMFTARETNDTFSSVGYRWFTNGTFTGVTLDTFYTTALSEGDSVYCVLEFVNSAGVNDSDTSNVIIVHHASSIPANVIISLTTGSNPDCAGHALTFTAYPVNGGTNPVYQWYVNGMALAGEDSSTISRYFGGADTLTCLMVSNSPCAPVDSVYSTPIPIIHIHLTQAVTISAWKNPVCRYTLDTLTAFAVDYGTDVFYQWYVNNTPIFGAVNQTYLTDSLLDGDSVYCVITSPDTCVLNPTDTSNMLHMNVLHVYGNDAYIHLSMGANPGCADSALGFTAVYDSFGVTPPPFHYWTINGDTTAIGSDTLTRVFNNHDIVGFFIYNDSGCYAHDSIRTPGQIIINNPIPPDQVLSLIDNILTASGLHDSTTTWTWYYSDTNSYFTRSGVDSIIPGATGINYHPLALGYYYVIATNGNCSSRPSNIIYISLLGVDELNKADVKVYPNPTSGKVLLNWGSKKSSIHINVYNALGTSLLQEEVNNQTQHETDLSSLPDGIYYLMLRDNQGNYTTNKIELLRK